VLQLPLVASKEHLELIQQGSYVWNQWREKHEPPPIDLICADLRRANLLGADLVHAEIPRANFSDANLTGANLSGATAVGASFSGTDLSGASLTGATLSGADFRSANLTLANLSEANLVDADLQQANLMHANLIGTDLRGADLSGANLTGADLSGANLMHTVLDGTNLSLAVFCQSILGGVRLGGASGLESCRHLGPSIIDHWTILQSREIPKCFLRGCGVFPALAEFCWGERAAGASGVAGQPGAKIQPFPCFIGYGAEDGAFAERLHSTLQERGILCWLAPLAGRADARFRSVLQDRLGDNQQLVLVVSTSSVRTEAFQQYLRRALQTEAEVNRAILCPVLPSNSIEPATMNWPDARRPKTRPIEFSDYCQAAGWSKGIEELASWIVGSPTASV
jgi:hypothetical protein